MRNFTSGRFPIIPGPLSRCRTAAISSAEGYCIIPYTRGRVRSRRPEDVVNEVERLAAAGYKEIVLTGIHLSSYGLDFSKAAKVKNAEVGADGVDFKEMEAVAEKERKLHLRWKNGRIC